MDSAVTSISAFLIGNWLQLAVTAFIAIIYLFVDRLVVPKLEERAGRGKFKQVVSLKAIWTTRIIVGLLGLIVVSLAWGVQFGSLFIFAGTTLTLLGVALFASWSLLSNVTAYFVLLLHPSFRRGTFVRIIDADNYAEGYISELSMFNTHLITENRETIVYPNNLLLSRPALINPRDRLSVIGKLPPYNPQEDHSDNKASSGQKHGSE